MSPQSKNHAENDPVLVVGLGASAGGLNKPLQEFFKSLPQETGMAFIVLRHLSPDTERSLSETLEKETKLKVLQVKEKTKIKKDHVYLIPPNKLLSVENHYLELSEPRTTHSSTSLQSSSEELETREEEPQSLNEEVKTVIDPLHHKVEEGSRTHNDLENLMEATEVGIIFLDRNFCVQHFTSSATEIFNLTSSDKGRSVQDITHSLDHDPLAADLEEVLENSKTIKKAVSTKDDRWFIMKMRPYHSTPDKVEGVVLSFTEFTELKEAREIIRNRSLQESLATLGVYVLEQDDLEMVMHRAIQQSCAVLDLKCANIMMYNEETNTFKLASELGCGCQDVELENDEKWVLGYSLSSKEPVTVVDYKNEKRFQPSPYLADNEFSSSVHISIRGSESVFGVFAAYSKEKREFSKQDLHFIQVVANILGRTIEQKRAQEELKVANARLKDEMKRSEQFQKEIINNTVLEQWELGGYLHDSFGQLLASVKILAEDIRFKMSKNKHNITAEVEEISRIMDMCMRSIRDVIHNIIPVDIENEGVTQAFRLLMNQTFKLYDVNCILESSGVLDEIKNRVAASHLYHIVQEAFKNAATHGKADNILVSVDTENDHFILRVKDDGVGLNTTTKTDGKGVRIMKHRMDLLGGTFSIDNYSDENVSGTVVTCTMPIENLKRPEKRE